MKPRVYIETTIPSYLTAWPSRDLIRSAHQQLTREWWAARRAGYDLLTSRAVLQEAGSGDPIAAASRLEILDGIAILETDSTAVGLANEIVKSVPLPAKAAVDALHIAIAVVNRVDFLLTWNCTHLANASLRAAIDSTCRLHHHRPTIICTPPELMGGYDDE